MAVANAQYNVAQAKSLPVRIAARARRRMYQRFLDATAIRPHESLLDVGATAERSYDASNYVEKWYPHKRMITACGLDDASFLEQEHPGLTFRRADGRALPFADDSFDVVHSSAVLEHVGNAESQARFVAELVRVARRVVFLTTPNRWFPVEFHTVLPLLHWLPKPVFRALLQGGRYDFFSHEESLNLLGPGELAAICRRASPHSPEIQAIRLLGLRSNLLVRIAKRAGDRR